MLALLFRLSALIPLPILHALATPFAHLAYHLLPKERQRIRANLTTAALPHSRADIIAVLRETAKGALELPIAFYRPPEAIARLFVQINGLEHIEQAIEQKQGLLFITPHLGSYDLAGRALSEHLPFPLTAMYKPPKLKALDAIMQQGRQRGKGQTAPANRQGIKQTLHALRQRQAVIILPDHVPDWREGDGVWVDFFNRPALTMTLAGKLGHQAHVCPLFFVGERLPHGRGFILHIEPLHAPLTGDKHHDARLINQQIEHWIHRLPAQYLFAYNRYKGTPPSEQPNQQAT